jgi:hypothetical protein
MPGHDRIYKSSDGAGRQHRVRRRNRHRHGTTTINVGTQLARVSGSTVFFAPHIGKLAYATAYTSPSKARSRAR